MRLFNILTLIFITSQISFPQQKDSINNKINYTKLSIIGGVTLSGFIYGHSLQSKIFWTGKSSSFHFNWQQDWENYLGADKFGHFYFPYVVTHLYSDLFEWSGIEREQSLIYSGSLALFYQTYVEVFDGFTKDLGFSWGDMGANILGSVYPYLQEKNPVLKNFHFKISFYPSERFKQGSNEVIFDDYESTYHWLSINIHNFLPENIKKFYPSFINLSVGHSVNNLDFDKNHELFLGLDWNLESLPGDFWLWKIIKKYLNFYHFPAPAVKIYPNVIWYGLKF